MERLLNIMRERNLDGYYISRPVNVNYISHYTGADSFLFITEGEKFFLTDPRYTEQAAMECPDYTIVNWRAYGSQAKAVGDLAAKCQCKAIGYEDDFMTVDQYHGFQAK